MKIGIVGSEEPKWTEEQKPKAKEEIRGIFARSAMALAEKRNCSSDDQFLVGMLDSLVHYQDLILVSGHCHKGGIDIWAEEIADALGIKKEIYPAEVNQWSDKRPIQNTIPVSVDLKGYRSRNIQIVRSCDILYDIEPAKSCRYCHGLGEGDYRLFIGTCPRCEGDGAYSGGTWTMKYARKLGKKNHKVVIQ